MKVKLPQVMIATWCNTTSAPAHYNLRTGHRYKLLVEERAPVKELEKECRWFAVKFIEGQNFAKELYYPEDRNLATDWKDWFLEENIPLPNDWWH